MTTLTDEELGTVTNNDVSTEDKVYRGTFEGRLVGTATTAKQLEVPFKLELQGDVAGNVDISGKQGVILQTTVSHATEADRAEYAGKTALATNANYADLANLANYAEESGKAKQAEYADEAEHAKETDHALKSDTADLATEATLATRAINADKADLATKAIKDDKNNIISETYAKDLEVVHKLEYLTNAIVKGLATGTGTIDERTLTITIDKIASGGLTIFEFAPFPTAAEDRDTTKIYVSQANKQFYIFNTKTSKWENLFDTYSVAINNLATKLNADLKSTKTELQNSINSNKTATDKNISGLETNLKLLIQNNKDYAEGRYVKKTGDTLLGNLVNTAPYYSLHELALSHVNDNHDVGGQLYLFDPENTYYDGGFSLRCLDMDNKYIELLGKRSGLLTWGEKNLVRSVNNVNADVNGNVNITTVTNATNATNAVNADNATKLGGYPASKYVRSVNGVNTDASGNVQLGNIGAITGEIKWFAFNTAPDGYLVCNGAEVSRETYADLFAVIGTTFGSGDGSSTFNLPDLRDRYIIGANTNALGTQIAEQLPNVTGQIYNQLGTGNGDFLGGNGCFSNTSQGSVNVGSFGNWVTTKIDFKASNSNSTYTDNGHVYPLSLALLPCIKY